MPDSEAIRAVNSGCISYQELKPWKYRLTQDHVCDIGIIPPANVNIRAKDGRLVASLSITGRLLIMANYCWDGASGPTVDTPDTMRASLLHDVMYQFMRLGILRKEDFKDKADRLLQATLTEDGLKLAARVGGFKGLWIRNTIKARAAAWYQAVKYGAGSACDPGPDPLVSEIIAP